MGAFKQFVEQMAAASAVKETAKNSNEAILRQAMIAELDAVSLYEQLARSASDPQVKKLLLDVAEEEKVHAGEFQALLEKLDKKHGPALDDGRAEVRKLLGK
jgi:rubrerythrin